MGSCDNFIVSSLSLQYLTQKGDSTVEVKARKDRGVVVVVPVDGVVALVPLGESTTSVA